MLEPFGLRRRCGVGVADDLAVDVDSPLLILLELTTHRRVMQSGVRGDGVHADVSEQLLHDVLWHAEVEHPGGERVAELMRGHGGVPVGVVDVALSEPVVELDAERDPGQVPAAVGVGLLAREQPRRARPLLVDEALLVRLRAGSHGRRQRVASACPSSPTYDPKPMPTDCRHHLAMPTSRR
ncbi:MAG: hypothetical protein JWM12_3903 [Ilumatobacteraceae bacterium]|nr:hypothetical protein [Ilumatobacteraceae bacterium]